MNKIENMANIYKRINIIPLVNTDFQIGEKFDLGNGFSIRKKMFSIENKLRIMSDQFEHLLTSESLIHELENANYWLIAEYESVNKEDCKDDVNIRNLSRVLIVLMRIVKPSRVYEYVLITYSIDEEYYRAIYHAASKGEIYVSESQFDFEYEYNDEDVLKIKEIFSNFYEYHVNDNIVGEGGIQSSILFFKIASETYFNEVRLVNLSIALECLFSTDNRELTYKLSQRVAFFIANNSLKRTEIFKNVKTIYDLRSKIVHGTVLKSNLKKKINEAVENLESYLRSSIIRILDDPKLISIFKNNTEINQYFDTIIME